MDYKEILDDTQRLQDFWRIRDDQMKIDRDMIYLTKTVTQKTDKLRWMTNEPKVFYDTATALISSYAPRFRLPLTINFSPEEKDKMNKSERFLLGIFRTLDTRQQGQSYWLRELAWWILSGWYAVFVLVQRNKKSVEFVADLLDPMTIYPEWGADRLLRCARTYEIDKPTTMAMLIDWKQRGLDLKDVREPENYAKIKLVNYWRDEDGKIFNSILLNDQVVKPYKLEKNFDRIPILTGAVGIPDRITDNWQARFGENIVAANRDMNEYENQMISLMATILAETAFPNIVTWTKSGNPAVKGEDVTGYGQVIPMRTDEKIELLKHAATPAEANILLSWVNRQRQKGALPDMAYGGAPFELSGFAISQLMAAIRYKIAPYQVTMERLISSIASEFLLQYKKGKFPKVMLTTTNPSELRRGLFFVEEFTREDVPEACYVDVTIPLTSAIDKTQQILFARQALSKPQLLSRETIWDEILDIQDAEQEYARIIQDETLELPVVKQIGMIQALKNKEQMYRNEGKIVEANAIRKYVTALEMQLTMPPGGQQQASKPPGVSPDMMPPEAMNSPDMNRAAMGMPPPGLNRRPMTTDERAESKTRPPTVR